tara:strand:+ start:700 stop:1521 length:822 start_codon:yes stop_codon:yes gene_type:complete
MIIINVDHGGLGDNLQFSTLPEEFYNQKNKKVYLNYTSKARNKEIIDLVWKSNPYIFGIVKNKIPNAGHVGQKFPKSNKLNIIQNWETLHELKIKNKYPKIYYKPKKSNLTKIFLVDISGVSIFYNDLLRKKISTEINFLRNKYKKFKFLNVSFKKKISYPTKIDFSEKLKFFLKKNFFKNKINVVSNMNKHNYYPQKLDGEIEINSLKQYCDYMSSCSGLVSLHHGQSHLSSAIKDQYNSQLRSFCIVPKDIYNHDKRLGMYIFDNIKYIKI